MEDEQNDLEADLEAGVVEEMPAALFQVTTGEAPLDLADLAAIFSAQDLSAQEFDLHQGATGLWLTMVVPFLGSATAGAVASKVWDALSTWLGRDRRRRVRLLIRGAELEITNATAEEQRAMVLTWIAAAFQDFEPQQSRSTDSESRSAEDAPPDR